MQLQADLVPLHLSANVSLWHSPWHCASVYKVKYSKQSSDTIRDAIKIAYPLVPYAGDPSDICTRHKQSVDQTCQSERFFTPFVRLTTDSSTWTVSRSKCTSYTVVQCRQNSVFRDCNFYNPKSEKVGTVWKTQIKTKLVISKFTTLTCISLQKYEHKIFHVLSVHFMSFVNIHPFLSFDLQTHSKKVGTVKHVPRLMLPFFSQHLKDVLGTEDTKWWSVSGVILSHSSCKQVLRWATVRGLRCPHFALQNAATHSLLETGRDCRQASQVPVPSSSAARTL